MMKQQLSLMITLSSLNVFASLVDAQTVQLPTYRVYSTNTTVSVPDGGASYLGGNVSSRSSSNRSSVPFLGSVPGLGRAFQNGAIGAEQTANQSWVTARIIDHREWDEAILGEARRLRAARPAVAANVLQNEAEAAFLSAHMGRNGRLDRRHRPTWLATKNSARPRKPLAEEAPLRLGSTTFRNLED